ncbi:hypothetical protein H8K47_00215 [Undibacterium sp. CY7W]|uniref:TfoX N-terminal domain-containing protein n=1 Tax=Undibacterium rugosum TaxID=2762291 RepID=A0A923KY20_9BURK|nr:hypothetical protein [Undibacterium rugosum]MBC3933768.1 hypothetical protein [Undibacterium rugosum]
MSEILYAYEQLVLNFADDPQVVAGQMFGKACLKVAGKAFLAQHKETIVFKLRGESHARALALTGAVLWDPSGKGRPMKEWVAVPYSGRQVFASLATASYEYVAA